MQVLVPLVLRGGLNSSNAKNLSLTNTGTLTLPTLTGTVSLTTKTVQVFTSGSGTYTTPTGCKAIWVRLVGGGGGGECDGATTNCEGI